VERRFISFPASTKSLISYRPTFETVSIVQKMKNLGLTSSCHGRRSGLTPERRWNKQRRFTDEFKREAVRLIHISGRVFGGLGILARRAVRLFK